MKKQLNWQGPLLDMSGYASAGRGYLRACKAAGIQIKATDKSRSLCLKDRGLDSKDYALYEELSNEQVDEGCPIVQHQVGDCLTKVLGTSLSIAYTIFEMDGIPKNWIVPCNEVDVIWTGSEYSKTSFINSGVKVPVHVVPHAIDSDFYSPNATPWQIENRRKFAFLSVMDFHERKAWKDLLKAFWKAFTCKDDVCLILKVYFGSFSEAATKDILSRIMSYKIDCGLSDTAPLLLYGYDIPTNYLPGLYTAADCYVGISREGFGLTYAEAMSCGVPTIGPEVGGTRAFMSPENSFLVKYTGDIPVGEETYSMYPGFKGLNWTTHSVDSLVENMRFVVNNQAEAQKKALLGRQKILSDFSYSAIGKRINDLL